MAVKMVQGVVKTIKTQEGFGFITHVFTGDDYFFHKSDMVGVEFETLTVHQRVMFEPGKGPKGPRAMNVQTVQPVARKTRLVGEVKNAKAMVANLRHDRQMWADAQKDLARKIAEIDVRLEQYLKLMQEHGERE